MELKAGYKKTDVGNIPEDWEVKTIIEAFDICNNLRLPISEDVRKTMQGEYPYYGPTKIQDYLNEYRVEGEFALIGEDGDHFLKWSEMPMTQIADGKYNVNNHAHLIKGKINITLTKWFYYFYKNRDITQHLTRQGAGRYKLSKSTLVKIPCAIPATIEEQITIIIALTDTDALISSLEKLIAKKRNVKQGAMQKLLQAKEGWELKKLGEIIDIKKGQLITEKTRENGNIPVIAGGKTPAYYHNKPNRLGKTITISGSGASAGYVSFHNYPIFASDCSTIEESSNYSIEFVFYFLQLFQERIYKMQTGGAQPHIHPGDLNPIIVSFPKKDQQIRIATILSDMDAEIAALETKLVKYRHIKFGMTL